MKKRFIEKNIILIGMMGSGKTTIGRRLASRLNWPFVDADEELERRTGRKISQIFASDGEELFRQLEGETIRQLVQQSSQVIATGGGVILREENIQLLRKNGWLVFLHAEPRVLSQRLQDDDTRPLLQGGDLLAKIDQLLSQRLELYQRTADWQIDTSVLDVEGIVELIVDQLPRCAQ